MASWPSIRAPLRDAWRSPEVDGVRRSPMDSGRSKRRGDSSSAGRLESFRFKLDEADRDTLAAFYRDNQALPFDLDHWVWGDGCEAAFDGPIQWGTEGKWWIADVVLEIWLPDEEEAP